MTDPDPDAELEADEVRCLGCDRVLRAPISQRLRRGPVCHAGITYLARHGHRPRTTPVDQLELALDLET